MSGSTPKIYQLVTCASNAEYKNIQATRNNNDATDYGLNYRATS